MDQDTIWFTTPAQRWLQHLPVGNGHIGCMISGDPACDTLSLNDDTLWSGYRQDYEKTDFQEHISEVRRLLLENDRAKAEEIVEEHLTNRFTQAFLPLGDLTIRSTEGEISGYIRSLDMARGIASAQYLRNGTGVICETFASYPEDVLVHTIYTESMSDYEIRITSRLNHTVYCDDGGITLTGRAPDDLIIGDVGNFYSSANRLVFDGSERGMRFAARVQIVSDGTVSPRDGVITVSGAHTVICFICSATSFAKGEAYENYCGQTVRSAARCDLGKIKRDHIRDHGALYGRVRLTLGAEESARSCEERLARMRRGESASSDIELLFQYGRYLLIASSRRGTQAANLQGIWNRDLIPPWWSGYTLNINLQMNYWLADRTNLSECFEPLASFVRRLSEAGRRTARLDYGAEGSVAHHQSDIWAHSTPVGRDRERIPQSARWMMWNMPLAWLSLQLYDHYNFTRDARFLRETLFPVMKDAAGFMESTFTRVDGRLCNVPSTSPENMYCDESGCARALCTMSAMDIGIAKEFALAYTDVCRQIGHNADAEDWERFSQEIREYSVSENGELREWDGDFAQTEPGHRHFSMLFGVYPGSGLIGGAFEKPARKALQSRLDNGSGQTGWSAVWAALLLARFGEGDAAHALLLKFLCENIHDNLFGAHPPDLFQIDANFGFTAAVCELLVQETGGVVRLLPALPSAFPCGSLAGVRIHGGHTVSFGWNGGVVDWLEIEAARDGLVQFTAPGLRCADGGEDSADDPFSVSMKKGGRYRFDRQTSFASHHPSD